MNSNASLCRSMELEVPIWVNDFRTVIKSSYLSRIYLKPIWLDINHLKRDEFVTQDLNPIYYYSYKNIKTKHVYLLWGKQYKNKNKPKNCGDGRQTVLLPARTGAEAIPLVAVFFIQLWMEFGDHDLVGWLAYLSVINDHHIICSVRTEIGKNVRRNEVEIWKINQIISY